jgi:DNA-binding transcriptional MocR family regulator
MKITIARQSSQPIYLQIHDRFAHLIQTHALQAGDRLPSIRALAEDLQVNKLTVIDAYSVLEAEGLIHSRQGSGYFVSHSVNVRVAKSTFAPVQEVIIQEHRQDDSFVEQYLTSMQAQQQDGLIDFSSGFPNIAGLDTLQRMTRRAIARTAETLAQYGFPQGQLTLRQQVAHMLVHQGFDVCSEDILITNGSEQALCLALRHYLKAGDWAIVESPTYHGALGILEKLGVKVIGIPMTAGGMNLELLEQYLQSHRPNLIYTISTLHNPTGLTTSHSHRQQLLTLAEQYSCPIVEDNAYEGLNFEPVPMPLKAIATDQTVTYIGTFSKTLIPGLRVGFMVVPKQHYRGLLERKLLHDLHTSTISQSIVSEYLASGEHRRHLNRLRDDNLYSRNVMLQALEACFPDEVSWTIPKGGLFLWVHLPQELPLPLIRQDALAQKVLIASGSAFFPNQQGYPAMRLNFSRSPAEIEQGIAVLGTVLKRHLSRRVIPFRSQTSPLSQPLTSIGR